MKYINIYPVKNKLDHYQIKFHEKLFGNNEYLIIKTYDNRIEISIPSMDYKGKMYKASKMNHENWKQSFFKTDYDIKSGNYYIDEEESNEDLFVFYLD